MLPIHMSQSIEVEDDILQNTNIMTIQFETLLSKEFKILNFYRLWHQDLFPLISGESSGGVLAAFIAYRVDKKID